MARKNDDHWRFSKLITAEPPGKCSLCKKNGHSSWNCREDILDKLGDIIVKGTVNGTTNTWMKVQFLLTQVLVVGSDPWKLREKIIKN